MTKRLYQQHKQRRRHGGGVVGLESKPATDMTNWQRGRRMLLSLSNRASTMKGTVRMGPRKTSHQIQMAWEVRSVQPDQVSG